MLCPGGAVGARGRAGRRPEFAQAAGPLAGLQTRSVSILKSTFYIRPIAFSRPIPPPSPRAAVLLSGARRWRNSAASGEPRLAENIRFYARILSGASGLEQARESVQNIVLNRCSTRWFKIVLSLPPGESRTATRPPTIDLRATAHHRRCHRSAQGGDQSDEALAVEARPKGTTRFDVR